MNAKSNAVEDLEVKEDEELKQLTEEQELEEPKEQKIKHEEQEPEENDELTQTSTELANHQAEIYENNEATNYQTAGNAESSYNDYVKERHPEVNMHEISILDDLRILRNRVAYEGFFVEPSYLDRNELFFKQLIQKLKNLIIKKLK